MKAYQATSLTQALGCNRVLKYELVSQVVLFRRPGREFERIWLSPLSTTFIWRRPKCW